MFALKHKYSQSTRNERALVFFSVFSMDRFPARPRSRRCRRVIRSARVNAAWGSWWLASRCYPCSAATPADAAVGRTRWSPREIRGRRCARTLPSNTASDWTAAAPPESCWGSPPAPSRTRRAALRRDTRAGNRTSDPTTRQDRSARDRTRTSTPSCQTPRRREPTSETDTRRCSQSQSER